MNYNSMDREALIKELKRRDIKNLEVKQRKHQHSQELFTENKRLYERILDAVTDGWWDWNIETDEGYLSPKFKALFGYTNDELPNQTSSWKKLIHPDDLPIALSAYNLHIAKGEPFAPTLRYYCKDGTLKWIF